jgi:hypothetical protein
MMDYYMPQADSFAEAETQLYWAVMKLQIRARCCGLVYDRVALKRLRHLNKPPTLPPDLELSVEDAKRKWGTQF